MIIQNSFAAGELAPALWSRYDLAKYRSGARTLKNFIALPYGGITNRKGMLFKQALPGTGELIPFQFNTEQAYVLVFTGLEMRIVKDRGLVVYPSGPDAGDVVVIDSPYAAADLKGIHFAQTADVMFLTHKDYAPRSLTRTDHHEWTFTTLTFEPTIDPPGGLFASPEAIARVDYEYFVAAKSLTTNFIRPRMKVNASQWEAFDATEQADITARVFRVTGVASPWAGVVTIGINPAANISSVAGFVVFRRLVGGVLWDAVETKAPIGAQKLKIITDDNTPTVAAWATGGKGTAVYGEISAGSWSGSGAANRPIKYVVSALGGGDESYPSEAIVAEAENPWGDGFYTQISWAPVTDAEAYNIYKNSRGQWGWVGQVDIPLKNRKSPVLSVIELPMVTSYIFEVTDDRYSIGDIISYVPDPAVPTPGVAAGEYTILAVAYGATKQVAINLSTPGGLGAVYVTPDAYLIIDDDSLYRFRDDNINPDVTFGYRTKPLVDFTEQYPAAVALYEQRLMFAGADAAPTDVTGSRIGSLLDFSVSNPLRADDPFTVRPATGRVDPILHLVPGASGGLLLFTASSEIQLAGPNGALGVNNLKVDIQGYDGCADYPAPQPVSKSILFAQRGGKVVRDISFTYEVEGYQGNDISILANHIFQDSSVWSWAYQKNPYGLLWAARADGELRTLTFLKEHDVHAWTRHITDGQVRSVVSIPGAAGEDELWFITERVIDSVAVFYLETLALSAETVYLDSSLVYAGAPATTFTGLEHLEGETVYAVADGWVYRDLVVTSGSITLTQAHSNVVIGMPYVCELETLDLDAEGRAQGRKQKVVRVKVRYQNTEGQIFVGPNSMDVFAHQFRTFEGYDEVTAPFTGDADIALVGEWKTDSRVFIRQTDPLPCTILAVLADVDVGG